MNIAYNMDCLAAMREMPDNAFDLAVVDPPYGIGIFSMTFTKEGVRQYGNSTAPKRDYRSKKDWDIAPSQEYFDQLFRVSKKQIIWGAIISNCHREKVSLYGINGAIKICRMTLQTASSLG